LINESLSHNHTCTEESTLLRQAISNKKVLFLKIKIKRIGLEDICERPSKILHSELKNDDLNLTHKDSMIVF